MTRAGSFAATIGGLLWLFAAVVGWGGDAMSALYVVGSACLLGALGVAGYALVTSAPVWLRAVLCIATPAFGAMVWVSLHAAFTDDFAPVLLAGLLALSVGALLLRRSRGEGPAGVGTHRAPAGPGTPAGTS